MKVIFDAFLEARTHTHPHILILSPMHIEHTGAPAPAQFIFFYFFKDSFWYQRSDQEHVLVLDRQTLQ